MTPHRYRPEPGSDDEWADNAVSNTMAWLASRITPKWCASPEHWTVRATDYFFTTCPCCLFFRGLVIGAAAVGLLVAAMF